MVGATAALLAATLLSIPANVLPVMTMIALWARRHQHHLQRRAGADRQRALGPRRAIFVASVVVPFLKVAVLAILLVMTHRRSAQHLKLRTRAYRIVAEIGRWSLVDVFAVTLLVSLVHMGKLAAVLPGDGALAFCAVVVLTMISAELFDPRQMWDELESSKQREPARATTSRLRCRSRVHVRIVSRRSGCCR
jgi:paraquat-inducible protein A